MAMKELKKLKQFSKINMQGQGMTEYIIIVALIAVAAIGTYGFFGQSVRNQVAGLTSEVSGKSAKNNITAAQASATKAKTIAEKEYNLSNYNEGSSQGGSETVD